MGDGRISPEKTTIDGTGGGESRSKRGRDLCSVTKRENRGLVLFARRVSGRLSNSAKSWVSGPKTGPRTIGPAGPNGFIPCGPNSLSNLDLINLSNQ